MKRWACAILKTNNKKEKRKIVKKTNGQQQQKLLNCKFLWFSITNKLICGM